MKRRVFGLLIASLPALRMFLLSNKTNHTESYFTRRDFLKFVLLTFFTSIIDYKRVTNLELFYPLRCKTLLNM